MKVDSLRLIHPTTKLMKFVSIISEHTKHVKISFCLNLLCDKLTILYSTYLLLVNLILNTLRADFARQHVILKEERLKDLFPEISLTSRNVFCLLTRDSSLLFVSLRMTRMYLPGLYAVKMDFPILLD